MGTQQEIQDMINKRQEANREILRIVAAFVEAHPQLRFQQILHNLGIIESKFINTEDERPALHTTKVIDQFHEESVATLKKITSRTIG